MARKIQTLEISVEQRRELRRMVDRPKAQQRDVRRASIVLSRADGLSQEATARLVGVNRPVVSKWEARFRLAGIAGLQEVRRSGRPSTLSEALKGEIISGATRPPAGRVRWSTRTMAKTKGVAPGTVQKLWSQNDIKPHLVRTFKLSNDAQFESRFWDVIGLYLQPPDRALVLCCDEKSQCQALERTQPSLPLGIGHVRTKTHDYIRHGTLTLFAALNYLDGKILRQIAARHTHKEWLAFLKQIDRQTPPELTLHLIADNYATHKHAEVKAWIDKRNRSQQRARKLDRIVMHFTPTSSSWMNMVERFFRDITEDAIREGSFQSVQDLQKAIEIYLAERDLNPKTYVWRADGKAILEKIRRAQNALNNA